MTIQQVVDRIRKFHEPCPLPARTRDLYLAGNPDRECTGLAVTVCATMEVLRRAAALGANLVITHESAFYGLPLEEKALSANDAAREKLAYIQEHGLTLWRYHDHMHGAPMDPARKKPDYIFWGICRELGWEEYVEDDPLKPAFYRIPPVPAEELARQLTVKFHLNGLRLVGDPHCTVSRVWLTEHVLGDKLDHSLARAGEADAFIPFEICDFTLTQYVVDSTAQGKGKVILEMGHFNCEELGMKYAARYLEELLGPGLPVTFLQAGDFFQYRREECHP